MPGELKAQPTQPDLESTHRGVAEGSPQADQWAPEEKSQYGETFAAMSAVVSITLTGTANRY